MENMDDSIKFFLYHRDGAKYFDKERNCYRTIPGSNNYEDIFIELLHNDKFANFSMFIDTLVSNPIISEDTIWDIIEYIKGPNYSQEIPLRKVAIDRLIDSVKKSAIVNSNISCNFLKENFIVFQYEMLPNPNSEELLYEKNYFDALVPHLSGYHMKTNLYSEKFHIRVFEKFGQERLVKMINFKNSNLSLNFYKKYIFPINTFKVEDFLANIYSDEILNYYLDFLININSESTKIIVENKNASTDTIKKYLQLRNKDTLGDCFQFDFEFKMTNEFFQDQYNKMNDQETDSLMEFVENITSFDERTIQIIKEQVDENSNKFYKIVYRTWYDKIAKLDIYFESNLFIKLDTEISNVIAGKMILNRQIREIGKKRKIFPIKRMCKNIPYYLDKVLYGSNITEFETRNCISNLNLSPRFLVKNIEYILENSKEFVQNRFCLDREITNRNRDLLNIKIDNVTVDAFQHRPGNLGFQLAKTDFEKNL